MPGNSLFWPTLAIASLFTVGCTQQASVFKDISAQYRPKQTEQPSTPEEKPVVSKPIIPADNPYDFFIFNNPLPAQPEADESPQAYSQRLREALVSNTQLSFVNAQARDPAFFFGSLELKGLTIFLTAPYGTTPDADELGFGGIGNCHACHTPPTFSSSIAPQSLRNLQLARIATRLNGYLGKATQARATGQHSKLANIALTDNNLFAITAFLQALNQRSATLIDNGGG